MNDKGKAMGRQQVFFEQSMNNLGNSLKVELKQDLEGFLVGPPAAANVPRCVPAQVRLQYPTPGSSLATPWWRVEWPPAFWKRCS